MPICEHGHDSEICAACAQNEFFGGRASEFLEPQKQPALCEHDEYVWSCHKCAAVGRLPMRISGWFGGKKRNVLIEEGARYQVVPENKAKLKHRGRYCRVLRVGWSGVEPSGPPDFLVVRFEDNGRQGHVDFGDLVPA